MSPEEKLAELETVLSGAVHDVEWEDKLEAAKEIRRAANRVPLITEDWWSDRMILDEAVAYLRELECTNGIGDAQVDILLVILGQKGGIAI